jgi:hypothetical protein
MRQPLRHKGRARDVNAEGGEAEAVPIKSSRSLGLEGDPIQPS